MAKIALVTGASRGIGRACAMRLAADGMTVIVNYRAGREAADKTVEEIRARGGEAVAMQADVSDPEAVKAMFRAIKERFGTLDVLVNNAGLVRDEYLLMMQKQTLDACFDLNVKGYFYCAQQAALRMMRKKSGVIVNMSSVSSRVALAGQTVYSATKGAVNALTRTMAKELAPYGIRVNAVAPGFISTDMLDALPPEKVEEYLSVIPQKRFGTVEEVAALVSFLASDASAYMTGQILVLDGGLEL